jgi:hypothetical protein
MIKQLLGFATLTLASLAWGGNHTFIKLVITNLTDNSAFLFLGDGTQGPFVIASGNNDTASWTPAVNGSQTIGLSIGGLCFITGGNLILNPKLYKGDIVNVTFAQQQFPTGIACSCIGSACDVG